MLLILLVILPAIIILLLADNKDKKSIENYYDITPYDYHWDIYKCYDMECAKEKGLRCYKWCNKWKEPGAQHNCRVKCLDYGDVQSDYLKFNNYTWNSLLPHFNKVSLLYNNTSY